MKKTAWDISIDLVSLYFRFIRRIRFRYIRLFLCFLAKLWVSKIHNIERLPLKGPAIIISNHASYYDWLILSGIYNRKYIVFLANRDLLNRTIIGWFTKLNIMVYVDKSRPGYGYFREVFRHLKNGEIVVIYPEGTRSRTGIMIEPQVGFVKLALLSGAPIIPIGMKGTYNILPPHKKIPRLKKCEVFVGEPIVVSSNNSMFSDIFLSTDVVGRDPIALQRIAVRIMDVIRNMIGQ